jgi:hypothetical protein
MLFYCLAAVLYANPSFYVVMARNNKTLLNGSMHPRDDSSDWLTAKLLLDFAGTVTLGYESRGTHDHNSLSHSCGSHQTTSLLLFCLF